MKKILFCFLATAFSFTAKAQDEKIQIQIIQGGNIIQPNDDVYILDGKEFSFDVTSENMEGFLIGATLHSDLYKSALGDGDLEVAWFENTGVADDLFNPNKEIIVSDEVASYWFYTNSKEHRFDTNAKGTTHKWHATRTISTLNLLSEYEMMPISKFKKSLFVYFYQPIYDEEYNLKDKKKVFHAELRFK